MIRPFDGAKIVRRETKQQQQQKQYHAQQYRALDENNIKRTFASSLTYFLHFCSFIWNVCVRVCTSESRKVKENENVNVLEMNGKNGHTKKFIAL